MPTITQLPAATTVGPTDEFVIVQSGITKQVQASVVNNTIVPTLLNGQTVIGVTGQAPVAGYLTPGANITITNAAGASTTITYLEAGINSVSATLPNILTPIIGTSDTRLTATFSTGGTNVLSLSPAVIPISANTTIYLVGSANFGTSTMTAGGVIIAQRIR